MGARLKTDLHIHTREGDAFITYGARDVIDRAAREGFRVLSISNHDTLTFDGELAAYARDRGIVLIPGVEVTVEGRHVLVYNADVGPEQLRTFADLRRYRTPDWLVVAPHPFFPASYCLRGRLWQEIQLFDAIEFSHFYTARLDFNRPAVKLSSAVGLPLIGTSDSHLDEQFGTTFSLVDADPCAESVLDAIRRRRVSVVSRPLSPWRCARIAAKLLVTANESRRVARLRSRETVGRATVSAPR